jgi:hypothetical protein
MPPPVLTAPVVAMPPSPLTILALPAMFDAPSEMAFES